jgi:hypothetical protein
MPLAISNSADRYLGFNLVLKQVFSTHELAGQTLLIKIYLIIVSATLKKYPFSA